MMKTEKRKANVGERILITDENLSSGGYKNGDILTVEKRRVGGIYPGVYAMEIKSGCYIGDKEYEVIVETPKKSARITALESQVATLQAKVEALEKAEVKPTFADRFPNTARFMQESTEVDAILADIERKAKPTLEALLATYPSPVKSPNEQRADVIKRARAFIAERELFAGLDCDLSVELVVNSDKRTVVALLRHSYHDLRVLHKGIAKCDPDDVFNADIGKAIALARALGVDVPTEFVKAVQPTASVGQRIRLKHCGFTTAEAHHLSQIDSQVASGIAWISDDTDAVYE